MQIAYVNVLFNKKVRLYRGTFAELSSAIKAKWSQKCVVESLNNFIKEFSGSSTPRWKDDRIRLLWDTLRPMR